MTRPQRRRIDDRLMHAGKTAAQIACDTAIAPFDNAAFAMEQKWGIGRLEELVTPDMASRYGAALGYLNEAIEANDREKTAAAATNCIRGLHAMDAAAIAAGHKPLPAETWIIEHEGKRFALVRDIRTWPLVQELYPGLPIHSVREVAIALAHYGNAVIDAKQTFPGAEITAIRKRDWSKEINDEIPF